MNFDKVKFSEILVKIKNSYGSINQMAEKSEVTSAYLSKLIRLMYDNAPSPEILKKIANHSNNLTSYDELMKVCGYIENDYSNLKVELEKELYKFDLTEDEYHDAINCFMNDSKQIQGLAFVLRFAPNFEDKEINKERQVLMTIMKYVLEFVPDDLEMANTKEVVTNREKREKAEREFYEKFDRALRPAKKMLLSLNKDNIIHNDLSKKFYMAPVYGKISAGLPNWAEECLEGYLPVDPNLMGIINPEECFFLRVNGESMNKVIRNGAYALIRKQDIVENGEIAAVLVNGFDATLKKFSKQGDLVILEPMSEDSSFTTQVYNKDTQIKILGKYIGKFEMN